MNRRAAICRIAPLIAAPYILGCGADRLAIPTQARRRPVFSLIAPSMDPVFLYGGGDAHAHKPTTFTAWRISDVIKELLDADPTGWHFHIGDLVINGTEQEFLEYYDPSYGRFKMRTLPGVGNHDLLADRKAGLPEGERGKAYYDYFGGLAGERGKGYYVKTFGLWAIFVLNSQQALIEQAAWLNTELPKYSGYHIGAMFHQPHFVSPCDHNGVSTPMGWPGIKGMGQFWIELEKVGCEFVVSGHVHRWERFPRMLRNPQNPHVGILSEDGIRQFVMGTSGTPTMNPFSPNPQAENISVARGPVKLGLHADHYTWDFTDLAGKTWDSGVQTCRKTFEGEPPPEEPPTCVA